MRLLHTADWHLGQSLYGYDRTDEFEHFFKCLIDVACEKSPDALLVCGDIFDVSQPSAASRRLLNEGLLALRAAVPEMVIIVVAGNHDSASRVEVDRSLWQLGGIHVIGSICREGGKYDFASNIITISGKGTVAAIPFVNPAFMPHGSEGKEGQALFFEEVAEAVEVTLAKEDNVNAGLPVVLMAHTTVRDCDRSCHRDSMIGGVEAVGADAFPKIFNYVALGHIHKPQEFAEGRVAYSGSPIPISFSENFRHTVSLVDIEKDGTLETEHIPVEPLREILTLPEEPVDFKKALREFKKFTPWGNPYIRLNVAQKEDLPGDAQMQFEQLAQNKDCRPCPINYMRVRETLAENQYRQLSLSEFSEITPQEIASRFLSSTGLSEETVAEYVSMIEELMQSEN